MSPYRIFAPSGLWMNSWELRLQHHLWRWSGGLKWLLDPHSVNGTSQPPDSKSTEPLRNVVDSSASCHAAEDDKVTDKVTISWDPELVASWSS